MAPDGERTSRKSSMPPSSTPIYSLATTKAAKPENITAVPNQNQSHRATNHAMASDAESVRRKTAPSSSPTPIYSLATTKAVKPGKKTAMPKQSPLTNLQQQQRQRQQQRLQQIRAIRRKRTVAFAVNHERVSQPHTACVVSSEETDAALGCQNSSSARSELARDTVDPKHNRTNPVTDSGNSTVSRDPIPPRASPATRDSRCTFQQKSTDFGEDSHVKDMEGIVQKEQPPPMTTDLPTNANDERQNLVFADLKQLDRERSLDTHEKNPKQSKNGLNRLVVDVRCAEAAASAASKSISVTTSSSGDELRSIPVPVTPIYLSHETDVATANSRSKGRRAGRPSKKQRSCPHPDQDASAFAAKLSSKPKLKRVRYDMECVPRVEINKGVWGNDNNNSNHTTKKDSSAAMTIIPNNEGNSNDLAQTSSNLLLQGSVLWIPSSRQEWDDCVSEMKAVCTSAAFRRWSKGLIKDYEKSLSNVHFSGNNNDGHTTNTSSSSPHSSTTMKSFQPPLSQAFIKDRVQIDDPLRGYQIRHAKGGWLQGFLVWTNFTVWTQDFQWDSNHPSSGLLHQDINPDGHSFAEDDGTLSRELQALPRGEQDPLDGGIVMKQVAEISLLGGLGCGELLLRKAIEDIRKSKSNDGCNYKYIVLQATEGSRTFYEKMGFVRVGAVCRYRWAEYCTNKSSSTTASGGKKPNMKKLLATEVARKSSIDPPPTFYGYRHWTYTNESYKSLDAHGGPSVMMCLKLEDNNEQRVHQDTVSELLQPHVVHEKPVIQLFGNVSNPESEKVAPTRKSQRRSSINRGTQQQQQEEREIGNVSHHPLVGAPQSGGPTAANAITRRTSNRSKRGRNASLADSGYVLYGVEGGRNSSKEKTSNATNSKTSAKRQRRSSKMKHNVTRESMKTTNETINDAVVVPSSSSESDLDNSTSQNGKSSTIVKLKGVSAIGQASSVDSTTNPSLSLKDSTEANISEKTSVAETSPGCDANSDKIITICIEKNTEIANGNATPVTGNESSLKSLAVPSASNISTKHTEDKKSEYPPSRIPTAQKADTEKVDSASKVDESSIEEERVASDKQTIEITAESQGRVENNQQQLTLNAAVPIRTPEKKVVPDIVCKNEEQIENSSIRLPPIDPLPSKDGRKTTSGKIYDSIEEVKTNKSPSSSVTRDAVQQLGTRNCHRTTIIPRKRSRRPVMKVNSSKLFKQKLDENSKTTGFFYNKVVIRRDVQNVLDNRLNKRRRVDDDPKKGRIRWRYNGGLMMDHRYEFCYYFVLHFDEFKKSLTIVPMLKDGVFERSTGSKNKGIHSTVREESVLDERLLGRPRYQCNILETDKNWIRDVPLEEYAIVPEAVAVFDTPLVAQEAWDIGDGGFAPHV